MVHGPPERETVLQNGPRFKIVDNVLIGQEKPIDRRCMNVGELVLRKLRSRPDFVGQVDAISGRETTYAEMTEKSVKTALWMRKEGIGENDVVGICTDNHTDSYVPLLSALYVGAVANPWDHELSPRTAKYFLSLTKPRLVFVNAGSVGCVAGAAEELGLNTKLVVLRGKSVDGHPSLEEVLRSRCEGITAADIAGFRCARIATPGATATIVCSSGTTGLPKGTEISHSAIIHYMSALDVHDLEGHVSMWIPTMRWYCGLFVILQAILKCSKRIIVPDYDEIEELCRFIEQYEVSWFRCDSCFPIRLVKFDVLRDYTLPSLKVLLFGGSHFRKDLQQVLNERLPHTCVLQSYGMTDFGGLCGCQAKNSKPGSCGYICDTGMLKVVDQNTGEILGANKVGEIHAKSAYMMTRYYNNPEATAKAIDSEGWLHTGDLGYYDQDGEIFLVDRLSEFINYRSINVSPAEIEATLQSHPSVLEVGVIPVPHDIEEEHAMAFVARVPGKQVTEQELMDLVDQNLPWFCKLYAGIRFLEKLPRTPTGKIAKKELKQLAKTLIGN